MMICGSESESEILAFSSLSGQGKKGNVSLEEIPCCLVMHSKD